MPTQAIRTQENIKNLNVGSTGTVSRVSVSGTVPDGVQAIEITGGASVVDIVLGSPSANFKGQSVEIYVIPGAEATAIAPASGDTINGSEDPISFGTDGFIGSLVATSNDNWELFGQTIPTGP